MPSISMPGEPMGMPGAAIPNRSLRLRRANTCSAGTWPSTNLPSITAVWQDARRGATPRRCLTALISVSTWSLTLKPLVSRWLIHFLQQPQLASRCTSIGISSAAWARVVMNRADSKVRRRVVFIDRSPRLRSAQRGRIVRAFAHQVRWLCFEIIRACDNHGI